jgi:hypothetical protein
MFEKGIFKCEYYTKDLDVKVEDAGDVMAFEPQRCKECVEERKIGSNTINEGIKKVKFRLGLIGDSFYSFKDDIEGELAEIYRILKDLEEKTEDE